MTISIILFSFIFISAVYTSSYSLTVENPDETVNQEITGNKDKKQVSENNEDESFTTPSTGRDEIELRPVIIKGTKAGERKKKNIQEVSRHTMTAGDLKEVPASFGDSINALTALPGIIRAGGGIFGPLVIRGADLATNNYFIDDIPINDPMHFGGLHSVINTNLMSEIDVYASAFPAEFGSATSAIISITTLDEVNEFGGYTDLSLLSASVLVKAPILKDKYGSLIFDNPLEITGHETETENAGYVIASGRYGYIALGIMAAELITGDETNFSPEYWDYQFKAKYKFSNVHSASVLLFGHKDFIRFLVDDDMLEEGDDPLLQDASFKSETMSHNQGLYFDSQFSRDLNNRIIYFSSLPDTYTYINFGSEGVASWAKDLNSHYKPWVFGLKDKAKIKWLNGHAELRGALEYTFYYFTATGKALLPSGAIDSFNLSDENLFVVYPLDEKIKNHLYGGYVENKFTYYGFSAVPGFRSEYLRRMNEFTRDPRIMMSYKFPTDTTIHTAGGHYTYFFQTNPFIFNSNPDVSKMSENVEPEKAWHSVFGGEQKYGLYSLKLEGFYNYFYDKPVAYPHYEPDGTFQQGISSGKMKTYGFEIMLRKNIKDNTNGLFGWMSYTYTRSKVKTGLPTDEFYRGINQGYIGDPYGDQWTTSGYEQQHCLKIVSGYKFGNNTVSTRFQFYTSFPYTPYREPLGEAYGEPAEDPNVPGRYIPYTGERNSAHFPPYYRLDVRYTYRIKHSWGEISWYVEGINVLYTKAVNEHKWYYDRPYEEGSNPENIEEEGFSFLPNFGVEVKF
ncbi:MAG: TonB-dependent receptor plug domain-containing protein [Spirochaetes bacterium]|nr:TonB-dependent receptor plug domain-containing protein [Spirochaetota bacterium]